MSGNICAENFQGGRTTPALSNSFLRCWYLCLSICGPNVWEPVRASHSLIPLLWSCVRTLEFTRTRCFPGWLCVAKHPQVRFFAFKLHLVFNDCRELLNPVLIPGNVDDRKPVPKLVHRLFGKLFGNKGYLSQKPSIHLGTLPALIASPEFN